MPRCIGDLDHLGIFIDTRTPHIAVGIGQRIVEAILDRDYPVVQAIVLITAAMFMLINLAVDLLYIALDPRIRT